MIWNILLVVALVIALLGIAKGFRAKTAGENLKAHILFAAPILAVFFIAYLFEEIDAPNFEFEESPKLQEPSKLVSDMKPVQLVLACCAFAAGYIGYSALMHSHWRRINKKPKVFQNPFTPKHSEFNLKEWMIFAGIILVTLGFGFAAIIA